MKAEIHYSCKHYFGLRVMEIKDKATALDELKKVLAKVHPVSYDTCNNVKRDCSHSCKLKITSINEKK